MFRKLLTIQFCLLGLSPTFGEQPPRIYQHGPQEAIYRLGSSYQLPCKATGYPTPEYGWIKDGRPLEVFSAFHIRLSDDDGTLYFEAIMSLDEGYYQCFAMNMWGKDISVVTHLRRAVIAVPPPTEPQSYTVSLGHSFTMQCLNARSVPKPAHAWELAEDRFSWNSQPLQTSRRLHIDDQGNLHFAHVEFSDERYGSLYKCVAFNPFLDMSVGNNAGYMSVTNDDENTEHSPQLLVSSPSTIILLDSSAVLRCFFSGKPTPQISWTKVNGSFAQDRYRLRQFDSELHINQVQWEDEGEYECAGSNGVGFIALHRIHVDVQAKPTFLPCKYPQDTDAYVGDTTTFYCDASAKPEADIQWYINGEPISSSNLGRRRRLSRDGSAFTIAEVCSECPDGGSDFMVIQCNASNIHGYAFASGYLNVLP